MKYRREGVLYPKIDGVTANYASGAKARDAVNGIAQNPLNHIIVSSSKPQKTLMEIFAGSRNVGFSAEHGIAYKFPWEAEFIYEVLPEVAQKALTNIDELLTSKGGFERIQKGFVFSSNYKYEMSQEAVKPIIDELNQILATQEKYQADGKVFEIENDITNPKKPQLKVMLKIKGKEHLVQKMLNDPQHKYTFGLALGDKPADAGMLNAMKGKNFYSVLVSKRGGAGTDLSLVLESPDEVHALFDYLARIQVKRVAPKSA
ncbi:hypothetical protein O181_003727 [Austropuccinia psidii MF-1]|uniref:Trehalose-phosphatase n=1 Tax=Austropuccinia psidii MF-1 TaxID=1389203 RepID=A0A9Q3BFD3_9BASI|nr:hypothetical protein [Austropuccinia psidii MF-1]